MSATDEYSMVLVSNLHVCNRCVLNGLGRQFACLQQMCTKWSGQAVCMSATDVY